MLDLYAFFLLAQFRETRAYPLLVQMFSTPGEAVMNVAGDFPWGGCWPRSRTATWGP